MQNYYTCPELSPLLWADKPYQSPYSSCSIHLDTQIIILKLVYFCFHTPFTNTILSVAAETFTVTEMLVEGDLFGGHLGQHPTWSRTVTNTGPGQLWFSLAKPWEVPWSKISQLSEYPFWCDIVLMKIMSNLNLPSGNLRPLPFVTLSATKVKFGCCKRKVWSCSRKAVQVPSFSLGRQGGGKRNR